MGGVGWGDDVKLETTRFTVCFLVAVGNCPTTPPLTSPNLAKPKLKKPKLKLKRPELLLKLKNPKLKNHKELRLKLMLVNLASRRVPRLRT